LSSTTPPSTTPAPLRPPPPAPPEPERASALLGPYALFYFYRRRLRAHGVQELLAGLGVAVAVALVFATVVVTASITDSAGEVIHTVIGPASLQLRARDSDGMREGMLARVERLPGVKQAAPLLEQTATILLSAPAHPRHVTVDLAGADTSLVVLDGLAHRLPTSVLAGNGIGLSSTAAGNLGLPAGASSAAAAATSVPGGPGKVTLELRGEAIPLPISAVLPRDSFGALSRAQVAVMPLAHLQQLAGLPGRITRVLVQVRPGQRARVQSELQTLAGGRLQVAPADEDLALLEQALRPSDQANEFFAVIAGLLGFLFAFNALLLTVPDRRRSIVELDLDGVRRSAIVQMFVFQTLLLGVAASAVGLLAGYAISKGAFHVSSGYLAEAFTLGSGTAIGLAPLLLSFAGGVLATCVAAAVPLLDLRGDRILESAYFDHGEGGDALSHGARRRVALAAAGLLALATLIFAFDSSLALLGCVLLALATVLAMPVALAGVLRLAQALAKRRRSLELLPVALLSLRGTTLRSLALAATGAVALFGSVALGGARNDLLRGIGQFAHSYSADAQIWVTNPGDNQATVDFRPAGYPQRIARVPGVASVQSFQGGFVQFGNRRVWIIARPPGADREVLKSQITDGDPATAIRRLGEAGWIAVSKQIAGVHHTGVGGTLELPTPSGEVPFKVAATTTNLAWPPGAVFISTADYSRYWQTSAPTALAVHLAPGASADRVRYAISAALGRRGVGRDSNTGLEVSTAHARQQRIDALTGEGLSQLGLISGFLLVAAILAMSAALGSAIWQRRVSLADLGLSGTSPRRLGGVLAIECGLMLGAGCVTGALAGIYGQLVIDGYLAHVTGFPVARIGASFRPLEISALVIAGVIALVAIPAWRVSRVNPALALDE
jgi:putative ABC transport system permease protein